MNNFFSFLYISSINFFFVALSTVLLLNSFYQDRDQALHAHPLQILHGKKVNEKQGGISKSAKAYKQRDIWWTAKHANARAQACECNELAIKHGANNTEQAHNIVLKYAPSLKIQPVYENKIPSTQEMIKFALNMRVTKSIETNMKTYPEKYENSNFDYEEFDEINRIQSATMGLDPLRKFKLNEHNNHAYLWWKDVQRDLKDRFKDFDSNKCKSTKSRVKFVDYQSLLKIIFEIDEENWSNGEPFLNMEEIIKDEDQLKKIQKRLHYRITLPEIKSFIKKLIASLTMNDEDEFKRFDEENDDIFDEDDDNKEISEADLRFEYDNTEIGKKDDYLKLFLYISFNFCVCVNK